MHHFSGSGSAKQDGILPHADMAIHWLRVTIHDVPEGPEVPLYERVANALVAFAGFEWAPMPRGRHGYGRRLRCVKTGAELWFDDEYSYCTVDLSGSTMECLGVGSLLDVLASFRDRGHRVSCSRVDVAADTEAFGVAEVRGWLKMGLLRTKAEKVRLHREMDLYGWAERSSGLEIGSRNSERFMRVYDRRGPTRMELEAKGKWSESILDYLMECHAGGEDARLGGLLLDFCSGGEDTAWSGVLGGVKVPLEAYKAVALVAAEKMEKGLVWLLEQVAPMYARLALLAEACGWPSIGQILTDSGQRKLGDADYAELVAVVDMALENPGIVER